MIRIDLGKTLRINRIKATIVRISIINAMMDKAAGVFEQNLQNKPISVYVGHPGVAKAIKQKNVAAAVTPVVINKRIVSLTCMIGQKARLFTSVCRFVMKLRSNKEK